MTEIPLPAKDIDTLKQYGLLREGETAVRVAEIVLAVNLSTQEKRLIQTEGLMLESNKRLLKG